jgi:glyoxylase-like metal-dependent hydrolase (beta-lactamase superfamily II)
MSLVTHFDVGRFRCFCLLAGHTHLDGGAMFGVVARPLWEKHFRPDERNRIRLALRCLLVEHEAGIVLIDTGIGNKENDKFVNIYGVENEGSGGRTMLEDALAEAGFAPEDVRYVINTHLHFDHAGGNTFVEREARKGKGEGGTAQLSFPNATYVVQRGELEAAQNPNERTTASYLPDNFDPITEARAWRLVDGETEILPGISVVPTPGHTPFHQSILISDEGETACYAGDCIPTAAHVPVPWIMAYDLEPLSTLSTKKRLLARAESEAWTVVFEHDPVVALGKVERDTKSYACVPLDTPTG